MKLHGPLFATFFVLATAFSTAQTATRPKVSYSTYFNGNAYTVIRASTVDANGYQYVTGTTDASVFPTTSGAYRHTPTPDSNSQTGFRTMFVAKLNRGGTGLVYSTLIANAFPADIAIDNSGNAYVLGSLNSATDFPTTSGAWIRRCILSNQLGCDFVLKLNATGSGLVFSTLLNAKPCLAPYGEAFEKIALDSERHPYILAVGGPDCFTTPNAYKPTFPSLGANAVVMKLTSDGSGVFYSTYVGGNSVGGRVGQANDWPSAIAVDSNGRAIIVGHTGSSDFPTTQSAFQRTSNGNYDAFVAKLSPDGSSLLASTLIGGSDSDTATGVSVDPFNQVYVVGSTASMDFPLTANAFQRDHDPEFCDFSEGGGEFRCTDGFVVKLPMDFSKPTYSTYLGGQNGDEFSVHVAADGVGHAFVTGTSKSTNFPLVKPTSSANLLMWLSELSIDGARLLFSTRYGTAICCTANITEPIGIGLDLANNAYVSGNADGVLTTPNAFQTIPVNNVLSEGFAAKWDIPQCTLGSGDRTVTICTPASTTVPKKLLLAAGATDSRNVSGMKVYVDGIAVFSILASHFNTYLNLSPGAHLITVKAWDNVGPFSETMNILAQ